MRLFPIITGLCLLALPVGVLCQDSLQGERILSLSIEELLNTRITVSDVKSTDLFSTSATVSVIDADMLRKYQFQDLAEALSVVPGINVFQSVIDRNIVTSRGILENFYANKILFMIDGVPTWQPIYGNGYIERINLEDVERIEVLKGPASVLYGSNAYTGIINVIMKNSDQTKVSGYLSAGYPDIRKNGASLNLIKDDLKLFLSANSIYDKRLPFTYTAARGFPYAGDSTYKFTEEFYNNSLNFKGGYRAHTFYLNWFNYNYTYPGAQPSYAGGGGTMVKNDGLLGTYSFNKELNALSLNGNVTFDQFRRDFFLSADRTNEVRIAGRRWAIDTKANYRINQFLGLDFGFLGERRESLGHDTYFGMTDTLVVHNLKNDKPIHEGSGFGEIDLSLPWVDLLVGSRVTYNELFGWNTSSRGSAVIRLNRNNSVKAMLGQAFRAPTMFELYFNHPTVVGNKELKPEISTSFELAYLFRSKYFFLNSLVYYAHYHNLITRYTPASGPPSEYKNSDYFEGIGCEVEVRYQNPGLVNLFINYELTKGWKELTQKNYVDNNYRYVPDHQVHAGINKSWGKWFASSVITWVSKVDGTLHEIDPQQCADLNLGYVHSIKQLNLKHTLSVKNITGSKMYIAEYIRHTPNINEIPTITYGRRIEYTLVFNF